MKKIHHEQNTKILNKDQILRKMMGKVEEVGPII